MKQFEYCLHVISLTYYAHFDQFAYFAPKEPVLEKSQNITTI